MSRQQRPPELDDPAWLRRAYERDGDMAIALTLGVTRKRVRLARYRLGIPSKPMGPRRGVPAAPVAPFSLDDTERAFRERYRTFKARRVPATETTLAAAIRAAHDALRADDANATDDALIDIAASAALVHDHRQKLRRAA
jgi:hypothetical protein